MKIKKIKFENFRLFENLEVNFPDSNFIVLIGNNGAGKTSILDGIAACFSHIVLNENDNSVVDTFIVNKDVKIGQKHTKVICDFEINKSIFSTSVTKELDSVGLMYEEENTDEFLKINNQIQENTAKFIFSYQNIMRAAEIDGRVGSSIIENEDKKKNIYNDVINKSNIPMSTHYQWFLDQVRLENDLKVEKEDFNQSIPALKNVKKALKIFSSSLSSNFVDLKVKKEINIYFNHREQIIDHLAFVFENHDSNNKAIMYNQLSSGQRMILSIVMDIARRLTIANENSEDALNGEGIVLIDELELHLHPNWQLKIVKALKATFPNVQFFATTHSPLVLSGMRREDILVLDQGEIIPSEEIPNIYSSTSDQILEEIMFADNKIDEFSKEKEEIDILFNKMDFETAESKLNKLKEKVGASPKWLKDYERRISFAKA